MAGRKGAAGFTRGGVKVNPVSAHPKQGKRGGGGGKGKSYDPGQIAALIGAGTLTGIVGAGVVAGLREGFGGDNRFGGKKR